MDATQKPIVAALKAAGVDVLSLAPIGNGCPDLLIHYRGRLTLIECKAPGGRLTSTQEIVFRRWPVCIVESADEALRVVGAIT